MNIFVLDSSPKVAAQYHCDSHVVKMILESAQMLSTALWMNGVDAMMKPTHINHPCSVWARETMSNYSWLCNLASELCDEYTFRYGKEHSLQDYIDWCYGEIKCIPNGCLTPFAQAMPDYLKSKESAIVAYRSYYLFEKVHLLKYTKREKPFWI